MAKSDRFKPFEFKNGFCGLGGKISRMQGRSTSTTILMILILVLTAPIWLTVGGIILGVFAGVFGAIFGIIGGIFGGLMTLITLPFRILFDWPDWHFHFPGRGILIVFFLIVLVVAMRRQRT